MKAWAIFAAIGVACVIWVIISLHQALDGLVTLLVPVV